MGEVQGQACGEARRRPWGGQLLKGVLPEAIGLAFVATVMGGFAAAGVAARHALRAQAAAAAAREGEALAQAVAAAVAAAAGEGSAPVRSLLRGLCRAGTACTVKWFGPDNRLRQQWPVADPLAGNAGRGPVSAGPVYTAPVYAESGERTGLVQLQLAARAPAVPAAGLWYPFLLVTAATLLVFLFVYGRLRRRLRPMAAIASSLNSYAAGIERELLTLRLSDSLGEVARSWNRLLGELAGWQQQLRGTQAGGQEAEVVQRFESRALRDILDRLPFGVLGVGHDQRVSYANAASGDLLDQPRDRLIGRPLAEAVGEEAVARAVSGASARVGGTFALDRNRGAGEQVLTLRFLVSPAGEGPGQQTLVTIQDVTHVREAERARDNFLYHVTHELRTPLTNIHAYTETLTKREFDDEQTRKECYNVIISETRRLSRLVEDILNVSQLEVGTARLEMGDVDLLRLVRQTVQDHLGAADEKGIDLTLKLPPKVPKLRADKQRLSVLLNNLIGNAIKYTPGGGQVAVALELGQRVVEIAVSDTGVGIAPRDQPHVFEKFYRAGGPGAQTVPGTGLGLAIAREVARLHGGDIRLDSAPGKGSRFVVQLPRPCTPF